MTLNGWLQILFFLLAIFSRDADHRRLHGPRVHTSTDVAGPGAAAVRAAALPADRRRRGARDALDGVRRRTAPLQRRLDAGAVRDAAAAGGAALEPAGIRRRRAGSGVQHRRVVHDQHQLAGVRRRNDDELFHADGRPRVSQLRVGRGRHRGGDRLHPRHRAEGERHHRQLLGGHGARPRSGCCCRSRSSARCSSSPRAWCRTSGRTTRRRLSIRRQSRRPVPTARRSRRGSRNRRSRRGRWPRRRSSSSSARTAAASSMRTARIRSRTRRRSRTSWRCSASSRSRRASPTRSAR